MMISVKHQPNYSVIKLQPNRSANWLQNKWLMFAMSTVAFVIATMWALFGIWFIFPFAGIEVGLLCYLLYRVSHQTYRSETISVEKNYIHVQTNRKHIKPVAFVREDTHLELSESPLDWYLPQVRLVSDESNVTLGDFLNQADRRQLYEEIKSLGIPAWRHHWWKH